MEEDIRRIREIIEEMKPRYTSYGGDIEFLGVEDGKVRILPSGYCHR